MHTQTAKDVGVQTSYHGISYGWTLNVPAALQ